MNPHFSVLNLNVFFLLQCFLAEYFISVAKIHESLGESQGSALQPLTFWAETSPTEGEVPVAAELSGRAARQGGVDLALSMARDVAGFPAGRYPLVNCCTTMESRLVLIGKSTISMVIFNSCASLLEGSYPKWMVCGGL